MWLYTNLGFSNKIYRNKRSISFPCMFWIAIVIKVLLLISFFRGEKARECKWKQMCFHSHPTFGVKDLERNYVIIAFIFTCFRSSKKLGSTNKSESYISLLTLHLLSSLFITGEYLEYNIPPSWTGFLCCYHCHSW